MSERVQKTLLSAKEKWIEENWENWCYECKHAYHRQDDADYIYCRLRKKECPHLGEWNDESERADR